MPEGKPKGILMEDLAIVSKSRKQEQLIHKYCEEAEATLATASDYDAAVRLKDSLCDRFQKECDSELVVYAVRKYIGNLVRTQKFGNGEYE